MLIGGIPIISNINGGTVNATLGLVVLSDSGATLFITAGHAVGPPGDAVDAGNGAPIGTVLNNLFVDGPETPDIASVLIDPGVPTEMYQIQGAIPFVIQNFDNVVQGATVTMQGAASGTQHGVVVFPNANVIDSASGREELGVAVAAYSSQPGDSGAPVWTIDGDEETALFGFHGGRTIISGNNYAWFFPVVTAAQLLNFQFPPDEQESTRRATPTA